MDDEITTKNFARGDEALPEDNEMRLYARAYASPQSADALFLKWETAHAHAMLLDASPERVFSDHGLNGRQLAEGARIAARQMALLMAETPTPLREVLALKVHAYETMGQLEGDVARSHATVMIAAAMKADAEHLGIVRCGRTRRSFVSSPSRSRTSTPIARCRPGPKRSSIRAASSRTPMSPLASASEREHRKRA